MMSTSVISKPRWRILTEQLVVNSVVTSCRVRVVLSLFLKFFLIVQTIFVCFCLYVHAR